MTVFTDHKRTANLELRNWDGDNWSPDWSRDFWNVGELKNLNDDSDVFPEDGPYAALLEKHDISASEPVYEVEDIDYLIDYANDMNRLAVENTASVAVAESLKKQKMEDAS